MAQGGLIGNGKKVAFSLSSPISWIKIDQLLDFDFPSMTADKIETTVSSTGKLKRYIPGLIEVGDLSLTVLTDLDPVTSKQSQLWDLRAAGTTVWWRIEIPEERDLSSFVGFELQGYVSDYTISAPTAERIETTITIVFDGTSITKGNPGPSVIV